MGRGKGGEFCLFTSIYDTFITIIIYKLNDLEINSRISAVGITIHYIKHYN